MSEPARKVRAAAIFSNRSSGSGSPVSTWPREAEQRRAVVAPVLHELARQLDRVPLDVADAGGERLLDVRQHVLQAVAELVEERLAPRRSVMQRRLVADRRRLIADQVGDGQPAGRAPDALVHPGAAALLGRAAVRVEVERGERARRSRRRRGRSGRPGARPAPRRRRDGSRTPKSRCGEREQAVEHARQREVRTQLLVGVVVALLAQPLGPEGDVPVARASSASGAPARARELRAGRRRSRSAAGPRRARAAPRAAARRRATSGAILLARLELGDSSRSRAGAPARGGARGCAHERRVVERAVRWRA